MISTFSRDAQKLSVSLLFTAIIADLQTLGATERDLPKRPFFTVSESLEMLGGEKRK
jgi:hypothetical protein